MKAKSLNVFALATMFLVAATTARAQVTNFFQAVTNLSPAAYWPLQETAQPPLAQIETNYGSLGAVANAYYSSTNVVPGATGVTGDGDTSDWFIGARSGAFLGVPLTDSRVSLSSPAFSVEAWVYPTNVTASPEIVISQTGAPGSGGLNGGTNSAGWVLVQNYIPSQENTHFAGWAFHVFNGVGATGGAEAVVPTNLTANTWYHLVGVFDGVHAYLYVDGVNIDQTSLGSTINGSYARDTWDQLVIGSGGGGILNNDEFYGFIDEVAVYTNALTPTQIANHYSQVSSSSYSSIITGDSAYMYWRMDNLNYTAPANSTFPVANNYGTVPGLNGLYLSGTTPGLAGPTNSGLGASSLGCGFNGLGTSMTNYIITFTNSTAYSSTPLDSGVFITNLPSSFNLISNNITVMCWFKANPADSRFQSLVGHSDNSWRLSFDANGKVHFNAGEGGEITGFGAYNDGNWHFAVGVYTNTGVASAGGAGWLATNYLYVDGILNGVTGITNKTATGSLTNIIIGGAPDYNSSGNISYRPQRYFSGSIAHVAYFTNALSYAQIYSLYTNATGGAPFQSPGAPVITAQPFPYPLIRQVSSGPGMFIFEAVVASGYPVLSYQWYYNTSSNYSGATTLVDNGVNYVGSQASQVTLTNLSPAVNNGYYYCTVTNNYGSVTSAIVNVQVPSAPIITAQSPSGAFSLFQNQSTSLSVTAVGETNLVYQWFTNNVADATLGTNATYSVTAGAPAVNGETFTCIVTNFFGSATSAVDTLSLISFPPSLATNLYSSNILALKPTGYWPMHEVEAPVYGLGDVETNYGTMGTVANGHYSDWAVAPSASYQIRHVQGALAGDTNPAVLFNDNVAANGFGAYYLLVPQPGALLKPPFSVECWWNPQNGNFGDLIGQWGYGQNANAGNPRLGFRMIWTANQFQMGFGSGTGYNVVSANGPSFGTWCHVVMTVDNQSNSIIYVNGSQAGGGEIVPTTFDPSLPLTIGSGFWMGDSPSTGPGRPVDGAIDEVAIYPTNLPASRISQHYNAGLNPSTYGAYETNVLADQPRIYFHMDAPAYTPPPASTWAVLTNYGSAGINGVYSPDAVPGSAAGPGGASAFAANMPATNSFPANGINAFADAGNNSAFTPAYSNAVFSYSIWFKGNPADCRSYAELFSAETNNWGVAINGSGKVVAHGSEITDITSSSAYNDGNWHQLVLTCAETNTVNATPNTNILYVDGVQVGSFIGAGSNNINQAPLPDVLIGDETGFTNIAGNHCFGGSLCEAAFFNGVFLTSNQVANLYNSAGLQPYITQQPISTNIDAGLSFTNLIGAGGSASLSYQWYQNGAAVSGATSNVLIFNPVQQTNFGNYYVIVTNNYGSVTSIVATLNVLTNPQIIAESPMTYTNIANTNYMLLYSNASPIFNVSVVGAVPLVYRWYTNGIQDAADQTSTLQLTNVQTSFTNYYCTISNYLGSITSVVWTGYVIPDPTNLTGALATYPSNVLALNPIGYWRLNEPGNNNGNYNTPNANDGLLCHDYAGGNDGIYTNLWLGMNGYSPTLDPSDTSAQFGLADENNDFGDSAAYAIGGTSFATPVGTGKSFTVEAWASGYIETYDAGIVTLGYGNGGEQFNLDCGSDGGTPTHAFRFFIRDASGVTHSINSAIAPSTTPNVEGPWYHLVGVVDEVGSQTMTLYINGVSVGSASVANNVGIIATTNLMTIGARSSSGTTNLNFQFTGNINDVAIFNYPLSASQVINEYVSAGVPPFLTQPPVTSTNASGNASLILPAAAAGTGPLTYWWNDVNGGTNIVTGTTNGNFLNSTLTVSSVPGGWNNDQLQLIVSNSYGGVTATVSLSVFTNAPQVTLSLPPVVNLAVGQNYTYLLTANGAAPLVYQWYTNGVAIAGATLSSNAVPVSLTASAGSTLFSVIVTNLYGAATNFSTLTVFSPPANSFASYILGLKPVGYWPLQETNPAAKTTIETNYGTLGALGNGYYAVTTTNETNVLFSQQGALTASGDNDTSVQFGGPSGTNELFVPRLSSKLTITAPFAMETWIKTTSLAFSDLISEDGNGLNSAAGGGNWGGPRLCYAGNNGGGPALQLYIANGSGTTRNDVSTPANTLPVGAWHHCVATYDGTNTVLYIDGVVQYSGTGLGGADAMVIDTSTPLTIGDGLWTGTAVGGQRAYTGNMDEVAIYTNLLTLTQVQNHYLAGTTSGSNYMQTVLGDNPLLYYRMDSAGYTNTVPAVCPDAVNFGSAPVNAAYLPGTRPGYVAGPPIVVNSNDVASPINGITASIDAGYNSAFNTTNTQSFSALCWVKGNPGDSHLQGLVTHGVNWALDLVGSTGSVIWTNNAGSVASTAIVNDGNWHLVAGVFDGVNNYVYVDGALNNSSAISGSLASDTNHDIYLGGDSAYNIVGNNEEVLGGAIAQAAFFTNALSGAQIQSLYQIAVPLGISTNPTNIIVAVTNNQLSLSWPADHLGWQLQAQTNSVSVGISTNWGNVSGSTATNQVLVPISLTNGCVFYRLIYP